ncbi:MAG: Lrp/AsnC family transcriptional regulator [Candidatus Hodarchaeales archaeon]
MPDNHVDIDKRIIDILVKDSRKKRQKIADELHISRQTVQKRIASLEKRGVIKFSCKVNERLLGKEVKAIILVTLHKVKGWSVTTKEMWSRREELGITEIFHVTGDYDIVVIMSTSDIPSLEDKLAQLARIEGVVKTQTMVSLSSHEDW